MKLHDVRTYRSAEPLPRLATGKLSKPAVREIYAGAHERLPKVR